MLKTKQNMNEKSQGVYGQRVGVVSQIQCSRQNFVIVSYLLFLNPVYFSTILLVSHLLSNCQNPYICLKELIINKKSEFKSLKNTIQNRFVWGNRFIHFIEVYKQSHYFYENLMFVYMWNDDYMLRLGMTKLLNIS